MNVLSDLMPSLMRLTATLGPDVQVKLAIALDAAIIFGALQERGHTGGFDIASTEQLEALYAAKVSEVTNSATRVEIQ